VSATATVAERRVQLQLPKKLGFLLECHPYKVAFGGRGSLKSWSFARALLVLGVHQDLRILCARETQTSIAQSVHQLLRDQIEALGLGDQYTVTENAIRGVQRNTLFRFTGLRDQTVDTIKSYEGFDCCWVEEAQAVRKRSWQVLLPTLFRTKGAECWVSFNPEMETDEVWQRFIVNPPPEAHVVEMNWRDSVACGWFTDEMERLRQRDMVYAKDDYATIWEGKPRSVVSGAIYSSEIIDLVTTGRVRPIPVDPRLPVHRCWDLGWNDAMACILVQKPHHSALNVVGYLEDSRLTYAAMLAAMDRLGVRWGTDWMPHDAVQHHPTSGTNAKRTLEALGCTVRLIPKSDPEARIRAARMMWPRVYFDDSKLDTPPERPDRLMGAGHLLDRLRRYRRQIPATTNEPGAPTHDSASHAADAFGGLAEIVERIKNEDEQAMPVLAPWRNPDSGLGLLG
jgi:phage terminase large subunit